MTEREIAMAVHSDGSISEMDIVEPMRKTPVLLADEEVARLVSQILGEKKSRRVRDYRAELKTKD